jgi:nicotinamide mononucleotide transporter
VTGAAEAIVAIRDALAAVSAVEWVAVALALAYLVLAIRQNAWCWAAAIVSSALYFWLFGRGGLYMQATLQLFYIAVAIYGWRAWRGGSGRAEQAALRVSHWPVAWHVVAIGAVAIVTALNGWLVARGESGVVLYVDAFVAWASVLATWLVARKVLENWLYWIVIDSVAATLYGSQGFHATAALFLLYVVLAVRGYRAWRADLVGREAIAAESSNA